MGHPWQAGLGWLPEPAGRGAAYSSPWLYQVWAGQEQTETHRKFKP